MKTWKSASFAFLCATILSSCQQSDLESFNIQIPAAQIPETQGEDFVPEMEFVAAPGVRSQIPKFSPKNRGEFCAQLNETSSFVRQAFEPTNQLSFRNTGGLFNGGVCWWHSLFTRSAMYLAIYRPDLPKPTEAQAKALIHSIAAGKKVIEIPGYKNLSEFSAAWKNQIQAKLEEWQRVDGFLKFAWMRGLSGSTNINPVKLEASLLKLIDRAENYGDVNWAMFQLRGITAHAGLMIGGELATQTSEAEIPAIALAYIDSNYVGKVSSLIYEHGKRSITTQAYGNFVPYVGRTKELTRFRATAASYCAGNLVQSDVTETLSNDFN